MGGGLKSKFAAAGQSHPVEFVATTAFPFHFAWPTRLQRVVDRYKETQMPNKA
jgi:hypothetical protein